MNINLTLFGQMVTFAFFVWFCMKYVWPMIIEAMEERQRTIADGLDAADRAMRDLEDAQSKVDEQMRDAKLQAADIIDQANKRVPVVAGAGSNNTAEAIELTNHASEKGADAALIVTPYYNKPNQEGLFAHYKSISENSDIPILIYNP